MVFSSLIFLFGFLPLFLLAYFLTPRRFRNATALLGSYLFYAWGAPQFVFISIAASIFDYFIGHAIHKNHHRPATKRAWLVFSLLMNVGLLGYYKYSNFFVDQTNVLLHTFGATPIPWAHVILPIGISFFTFQEMSYIIDVYWGKVQPAKRFVDFAMYLMLFPQLIAGPIVRYIDIAKQITSRDHSIARFSEGVMRFVTGLAKKVLIANTMAQTADIIFSFHYPTMPPMYAWLGVVCYALQIYFDFSGYSDMAIGLGKMLGFDFLENFNYPYIARSMTDFWRRWHISLSTWMKEYVYIPLGGNRVSHARQYVNLFVTFLISGFWHGASWTFLAWGAYNGFFLVLDKVFAHRRIPTLPKYLAIPVTFIVICVGWVIFRVETLGGAWTYLTRMFAVLDFGSVGSNILFTNVISHKGIALLIVAAIVSTVPGTIWFDTIRKHIQRTWSATCRFGFQTLVGSALFTLSILELSNAHFNPFIYFRF